MRHLVSGIWYQHLSLALLIGLCRQKLLSDIFVYAVNNRMSGMFFPVLWIVFVFGEMSGSLNCFVVSCPSHFWFSSLLVSFLSTAALRMPLIA